jgi:tetratricopeptide (TPR) repeat protein
VLAQLSCGHLVLTTRRDTDWQRLAVPIQLDVLSPAAAAQVITARTGWTTARDQAGAAAVAAELGFLPLALDQAAAYMVQARIGPGPYLDRLRRNPARLHAAAVSPAQQTISRLWDLTLTAITARDPDAIALLHVIACYAPDNIPRAIVGTGNTETADEQLGVLASYSMITLTTGTASIHRLVQAVLQARQQTGTDPDHPALTALQRLNDAIPPDPHANVSAWPFLRTLIPHASSLRRHFAQGQPPLQLSDVENQIGVFVQSQGSYLQALDLRESALRITETALGPDHPDTATCLGNLALTYSALGRAGDALPLAQRALHITETTLGPDHPHVATRLGNLALTYNDLDRAGDALPLAQRAQAIRSANSERSRDAGGLIAR